MSELIESFRGRRAIIGVVGLGYVGLPLAATIAEAGFATIGFDTDASKIQSLREHRSYIRHVPSERLAALALDEGALTGTDWLQSGPATMPSCRIATGSPSAYQRR